MKLLNHKFWIFSGQAVALFLVAMGLNFGITPTANATPAFARNTGAECQKCHTVSFPRLNWMGERYMRNGFALPTEGALDLGGLAEEGKQPAKEKKLKNLVLKDVGDIFSVRGSFIPYDGSDTTSNTSIGSPGNFYLFASGQIADDIPIWAEAESGGGAFEVHNYFIGRTNLKKSTLYNVRVGGFTPTEWISVSDQKRSLDSANSHPGSYRGKNGFTQVAEGLGGKTALEYYGYNDSFFWALAYGDGVNRAAKTPNTDKTMWAVGRYDFLKGSSASILYYDGANDGSGYKQTAYVLSGNYRVGNELDIRAQYSLDNAGDNPARSNRSGVTLQADYQLAEKWMAIARYDTTDNGLAVRPTETQATIAAVYAPVQNVKMTASYAMELDRAQYGGGKETGADDRGTTKSNFYRVQVQFAF